MPQLFPRRSNAIARGGLLLLPGVVGLLIGLAYAINSAPYVTRQEIAREQPVPFSHKHHVGGLGLDCRYCHTSVEEAAFAGIPPTHTCMTCHSQIWSDSPMLAEVRKSFRENKPLQWQRVHDLPDFVYFDHSIHIAKGVGCSTCHGRVDAMPLTWKAQTLQMGWCLECHRAPERYLRPQEQVFNMAWSPGPNALETGEKLAQAYGIQKERNESCYVCHR